MQDVDRDVFLEEELKAYQPARRTTLKLHPPLTGADCRFR
jgi:hypothetical protein